MVRPVAADEPMGEAVGMGGQAEVVELESGDPDEEPPGALIHRGWVDALPESRIHALALHLVPHNVGVRVRVVVGAAAGPLGEGVLTDERAEPCRRHPHRIQTAPGRVE